MQALLHSQSGPCAAAWLGAVPSKAGTTIAPRPHAHSLAPAAVLAVARCTGPMRGPWSWLRRCNRCLWRSLAACPRTGLLARRAKLLEHAWIRVVREAGGVGGPSRSAEMARSDACPWCRPGRSPLPSSCTTRLGEALCCDVTLVTAALAVAERRKCRRCWGLLSVHLLPLRSALQLGPRGSLEKSARTR